MATCTLQESKFLLPTHLTLKRVKNTYHTRRRSRANRNLLQISHAKLISLQFQQIQPLFLLSSLLSKLGEIRQVKKLTLYILGYFGDLSTKVPHHLIS